MRQTKLDNCSVVKMVLMLVIILYHSTVFWKGDWWDSDPFFQSKILGYFAGWLNSFHIYAFSLVSGYIFAYKIERGSYQSYSAFIINKAKRLLIPYIFVALVWVAPISAYFFDWDWGFLAKKYLLAIEPSQLWFLWMLFGVFAIVWPIRMLMLEKPLVGWVASLAFFGIGLIGRHIFPNVFCVWTACQYVLFFFIGMRIRTKEEKQEKLITEAFPWYCWVIVDLLIFSGTIMIGQHSGTSWSLIVIVLNMILHVVGAIMSWTALQTLTGKVNWKDSKAFKTLSSYSMPIYLFHQQIIYFTIVWLNGKVNPWIHAGVNFIIALTGSFLISLFLMHWRITRFLIGEK